VSHKVLRAQTGADKDGKKFYSNIGRYMETKAGPMIKLDVIPVGWDGWAYVSDPLPPKGQKADDMDDIPL
jgi:hypothetical protein